MTPIADHAWLSLLHGKAPRGSMLYFSVDEDITGRTFSLLDSFFMMKSLGFKTSEAATLLLAVKSIIRCYEVTAKYCGALKTKGIRAAVYRNAQAHYSLDRLKSICYDDESDDESDDLLITVWFKKEELAQKFRCFLGSWHLTNPVVVKRGDIIVDEKITSVLVEMKQLSPVLLSHYVACASESPVQSLEEFAGCPSSVESTISLSGNFAQLQSVEKPSVFTYASPYACHIKPRRFTEVEHNENNKLAASWTPFHQFFNGLKTRDIKTGHLNLPLIALKPLEDGIIEEMIGDPLVKRRRVEIEIEYRDPDVAKGIDLKEGSTKISDVKWKTFVHVEDPQTLCKCLKWKYNHTVKKWKEADQFDQYAMDRNRLFC